MTDPHSADRCQGARPQQSSPHHPQGREQGRRPGFCAAEQDAIRAILARIEAGWAANDADAVAAVFTTDTDFVIGDGTFLRGREELRQYMADAFDGFLLTPT